MCLAIPGLILSIDEVPSTEYRVPSTEYQVPSTSESLGTQHSLLGTFDSALNRVGQVKFGGITKEVNLAYVPEAKVGDYVIVHVGFAISTLNEAEANRVFDYLREMDELAELSR